MNWWERIGIFPAKESPIDLDSEMRADGWIDIREAAAVCGLDVKFLRESTKIVKRWPKDPNDTRTWIQASVAEQLRKERTFWVPIAPRPQGSIGPTIVAEATFGIDDLSAKPGSEEVDRLRAHDNVGREVRVTTEGVTAAAYRER